MTTRTTRRAIESDEEMLRFEPDTPEFSVEFDEEAIVDHDETSIGQLPSPMDSEYHARLLAAQEQLQALRQQQEAIECQKRELEEMNHKQRSFASGKTDLGNRLSRAISMLEREAKESRRRTEQFDSSREAFEQYSQAINALNPENWDRAQLRNELGQALAMIEDTTDDFEKQMTKVNSLRQLAISSEPAKAVAAGQGKIAAATVPAIPTSFQQWFFMGLAFTLPLFVLGAIALIVTLLF